MDRQAAASRHHLSIDQVIWFKVPCRAPGRYALPAQSSELETKCIRPAVVIARQSRGRQAVKVLEEAAPEVPVARKIEVQIELVVDPVPVVDCQARVIGEARDEI